MRGKNTKVIAFGKRPVAKRALLMAILAGMGGVQAEEPTILHATWNMNEAPAFRQVGLMDELISDVTGEVTREIRRRMERAADAVIEGATLPFSERYALEMREARRYIHGREVARFVGEDLPYQTQRAATKLGMHLYMVALHQGAPDYFEEAAARMEVHLGCPSMALTHLKLADERGEVRWPSSGTSPEKRALWVYRNLRRLAREGYLDLSPRLQEAQQEMQGLRLAGSDALDAQNWFQAAQKAMSETSSFTLDHLAWMAAQENPELAPDLEVMALHRDSIDWGGKEPSPVSLDTPAFESQSSTVWM